MAVSGVPVGHHAASVAAINHPCIHRRCLKPHRVHREGVWVHLALLSAALEVGHAHLFSVQTATANTSTASHTHPGELGQVWGSRAAAVAWALGHTGTLHMKRKVTVTLPCTCVGVAHWVPNCVYAWICCESATKISKFEHNVIGN